MHRNKNPKNSLKLLLSLICSILLGLTGLNAQEDSVVKHTRIAIFSPLYLDSAFDETGLPRHDKVLPRYFNAGLDFYEGLQLAIDSLQKEGVTLEIEVFDTRSGQGMAALLQDERLPQMDLFIGCVNVNEAAWLANAAARFQIPFINVNLPNSAGVTNNPYYFVLNPTLSTHCHAIYRFLQKNYALSSLLYIRKKGGADDMLRKLFTEAERASPSVPLKMKTITLEDSVGSEDLKKFLTPGKSNTIILASLDANFALSITRQLARINQSYKIVIMGMPTWDQVDFTRPAYHGLEILYGSPYRFSPEDPLVQQTQTYFKDNFYSRTEDLSLAAFEALYHYAHLLQHSVDSSPAVIAKPLPNLFSEWDLQPVMNKQTGKTDYYENKKIYFIRKTDGNIKAIH